MEPKGDRRVMADLWLGHLAVDLAAGGLPAVLVFLKPVLHLSYTKAGAAVLVATVTSSVARPLFGRRAGRRRAVQGPGRDGGAPWRRLLRSLHVPAALGCRTRALEGIPPRPPLPRPLRRSDRHALLRTTRRPARGQTRARRQPCAHTRR